MENKKLTQEQEELLVRFFDGECGVLERKSVRGLIEKNEVATEFLSSLGQGSRAFREHFASAQSSADLWGKVLTRIEQEERAEIFLGSRKHKPASNPFELFGFLAGFKGMALSGALATAALLFFILPASNLKQNSNGLKEGLDYMSASEELGGGASFRSVSSSSPVRRSSSAGYANGIETLPQLVEDSAPSSIEVDWVRSHGRVNLMQEPGDKAPIIWIKKRNPMRSVPVRSRQSFDPYSIPGNK